MRTLNNTINHTIKPDLHENTALQVWFLLPLEALNNALNQITAVFQFAMN